MATFIEVNAGTAERTIVNFDTIRKVVPNIRNDGTIIHIDQNTTVACIEQYEDIKNKLIPKKSEPKPTESKDVTKS